MISVKELMFKLGFRLEIVHTGIEAYAKMLGKTEIRVNSLEEPETPPERYTEAVSVFFRGKDIQITDIYHNLAEFITKGLGPNRIVTSEDGDASPPRRVPDLEPEVVFIRDDGWMLAAPGELVEAARKHWPKNWIAVIRANPWRVEAP